MSVEPWDCLSCGARAQSKQFCETCGAAMPVEGEDSALSMMMGLVCENCDTFNDPGVTVCMTCSRPLGEGAPLMGDMGDQLVGDQLVGDQLVGDQLVGDQLVGDQLVGDQDQGEDAPFVTPVSGSPRPISGVGDGIDFDPKTQPPMAPPPMPAPSMATPPPPTSTSAPTSAPTSGPPSWMSAPTGQPLATQFAMPKVDLASVAREGQGLTAPKPHEGAAQAKLPTKPTPAPFMPPIGKLPTPAASANVAQLRPTSTPLATPMPPPMSSGAASGAAAAGATPGAKPAKCWRCGVDLEKDDKFCRNCGARSDAPAASPLATTQIAAGKMPGPLPSPMMPVNATMVMPAMRAAQQGIPANFPGGADARAAASGGIVGAGATLVFSAPTGERHAKLILVRGQSHSGSQWRLAATETWIGRAPPAGAHDAIMFHDDPAMARAHCRLVFHGNELWLEPEQTLNGVFLRVREAMRLGPGDEMVVGAQRLRVMGEEDRPSVVAPDDQGVTRTLGSLVRQAPPIMLMRVGSEPSLNEVFHRSQRLLTIGRNNCDLNFPRDSFVSERHAQITHEGSAIVLEDLRSRNGTYVRARYATKLAHGDLVLLGDKVLRVELPR